MRHTRLISCSSRPSCDCRSRSTQRFAWWRTHVINQVPRRGQAWQAQAGWRGDLGECEAGRARADGEQQHVAPRALLELGKRRHALVEAGVAKHARDRAVAARATESLVEHLEHGLRDIAEISPRCASAAASAQSEETAPVDLGHSKLHPEYVWTISRAYLALQSEKTTILSLPPRARICATSRSTADALVPTWYGLRAGATGIIAYARRWRRAADMPAGCAHQCMPYDRGAPAASRWARKSPRGAPPGKFATWPSRAMFSRSGNGASLLAGG